VTDHDSSDEIITSRTNDGESRISIRQPPAASSTRSGRRIEARADFATRPKPLDVPTRPSGCRLDGSGRSRDPVGSTDASGHCRFISVSAAVPTGGRSNQSLASVTGPVSRPGTRL